MTMLSNDLKLNEPDNSQLSQETAPIVQRVYKTARRRSLSGSAIPSKSTSKKIIFGFKHHKVRSKTSGQSDMDKDDITGGRQNADFNQSEMDISVDSNSSSSGMNVIDGSQKFDFQDGVVGSSQCRKASCVSAKTKIKHYIAEHIVKTHPCHHPEYHFHSKNSDFNVSHDSSKMSECQEDIEQDSCDSHSSSLNRPKSVQDQQLSYNYTNMATVILDKIRHISIQPLSLSPQLPTTCVADDTCSKIELDSETGNSFPNPEPNPSKMPKADCLSSIVFSNKSILHHKMKRQRLAHSVSYDPDYKGVDFYKYQGYKTNWANVLTDYSPEKNKWERKISGYLDTSTPTGAAITAINFGLKRVTETDKYVMITKSPISSPNEFLEDGISHLEASSGIYNSLMQHTSCYDLMPDSGKVIVIDSQMQIDRAFNALDENGVRASPIWSSEKQEFIALLTANDLVPLLLHLQQLQRGEDHCVEDENVAEDFSTVTVEKCLSIIPRFRTLQNRIAGVSPESNLHSVSVLLHQLKKVALLVIDYSLSGNPLFLLSDLRILTYLNFRARSLNVQSCFNTPISSVSILIDQKFEFLRPLAGNKSPCHDLCTKTSGKVQYLIYLHSLINDVLRAMATSYSCCALIVCENQLAETVVEGPVPVFDIITIADILHLVHIKKHKDPSMTASDILFFRKHSKYPLTNFDVVISCSVQNSVDYLMDLMVKEKADFVLIRDNEDIHSPTIAVLKALDILHFINKQPSEFSMFSNCSYHIPSVSLGGCEKDRRSILKHGLDRSNSDVTSSRIPHRNRDDKIEEVFSIDVP